MSMVLCQSCGTFIDSDLDPDCFVEVPRLNLEDRVWCESCREEKMTEEERNSQYA